MFNIKWNKLAYCIKRTIIFMKLSMHNSMLSISNAMSKYLDIVNITAKFYLLDRPTPPTYIERSLYGGWNPFWMEDPPFNSCFMKVNTLYHIFQINPPSSTSVKPKKILNKDQPRLLLVYCRPFSQYNDKYGTKLTIKVYMMCLGFEHGTTKQHIHILNLSNKTIANTW